MESLKKEENVHVSGLYVNEKGKKEGKCPRIRALRERKGEDRGKMSTYGGSTWMKSARKKGNVHVSGLYVSEKGKKEGKCPRIRALRERKGEKGGKMSTYGGSTWTKRGRKKENVHVSGPYVDEK
jgi:hypothetical protein